MKKLALTFSLMLCAAAAAHAQGPGGAPGSNPVREAMREGNATKADEAHIRESRINSSRLENEANAARRGSPPSFKAQVEVTNHGAKTIKAVNWTATLTDPSTGDVISSYDVTSKAKIEPGKTKKLSKQLRAPSVSAATVTRNYLRPSVIELNVEVNSVTYSDGTTSSTP